MKRLRKTQSDVTTSDCTSEFVKSHRTKSLHLLHDMKAFEEGAEMQIDPLQTSGNTKDPVVLIKEGDLAGLIVLIDSMQVSMKCKDESGFTLLHYAASHNRGG